MMTSLTFHPNIHNQMGLLIQLNSHNSSLFSTTSHNFKNPFGQHKPPTHLRFSKVKKVRAVEIVRENPESETSTQTREQEEEAVVNFAFVHSVLLPDGMPDVHYRTAKGGQKLRDIMLDNEVELYGPYARPLLNCAGGGTCATCIVEVVQGKELLSPRTVKENEKLKKHPKNWRLACQATVGTPDSRGLVVIQQLPEWKSHEWNYGKELPPEGEIVYV